MAANYRIKTPHAAVLVWNYVDRIGTEGMTSDPQSSGVQKPTQVEPMIISTLSCISIATSKSKGQPEGTFEIALAPTKDWVSTLTAGSWLAILMSNTPIVEKDLQRANKNQVKMIGKIESVRADVTVDDDAARHTRFLVTGVDWGHIFNNIIYVDNLIAAGEDQTAQGNTISTLLTNSLFAGKGTPQTFFVKDNLSSLIQLFGQNVKGLEKIQKDINHLAGALYNFNIPQEMATYFNFVDDDGDPSTRLNKLLRLITGSLKGPDHYIDSLESKGFLNPMTLQGQHTFWQVLIENSNPILNEMYPEMRWNMNDPSNNSLQLTIYNRIKPFSYNSDTNNGSASFKSYFQNCRLHTVDDYEVISVNAGTNWRDKFNFIEVKPNFTEFDVIANWTKQKSQAFDAQAFEREGFRPLILESKQFPSDGTSNGKAGTDTGANWDQLEDWALIMREWYFNTHRMLNGTIVLHGSEEYIAVGDNIRFNAGLINVTPNINAAVANSQSNTNQYVLCHVENISNSFSVSSEGARSFITTIQFVRGIIVNGDNKVQGQGPLDKFANKVTINHRNNNTINTVSTSEPSDPDPLKLRGT